MEISRRQVLAGAAGVAVVAGAGFAIESAGSLPKPNHVVVYGATASGVLAACAAAQDGARVTLVAGESPVGGMVSHGISNSDVLYLDTLGGMTQDFFACVGARYGSTKPVYVFEPHVSQAVFDDLLAQHDVAVVKGIVSGVAKRGKRISELSLIEAGPATSPGTRIAGGVLKLRGDFFIDASYEGQLMFLSGAPSTYGRESTAAYGESMAGQRAQLTSYPVSPDAADGSLVAGCTAIVPEPGAKDDRVMAYNYRLCLSDDPDNQIAFTAPPGYDPENYVLLVRNLPNGAFGHPNIALPNHKFDLNGGQHLLDSDFVNGNHGFPAARLADRRSIAARHRNYQRGLLYFLSNDPRVPNDLSEAWRQFGYAADEFVDTGHWPGQLYIRECRRLLAQTVITQRDVLQGLTKPDSIGIGSYYVDSHPVLRYRIDANTIGMDGPTPFREGTAKPYQIPFSCMVPYGNRPSNLLVSVCIGASHIAWCSIRMEPQFMTMGEAAGRAAAIATDSDATTAHIDYKELRKRLLAGRGVLTAP